MSDGPLPAALVELLDRPNPAVVATVRPDGTPHTSTTWYEWRDGHVLLSMDHARARLGFMRRNPAVSLTVLDGSDWSRHLTLFGRVERLSDDGGLRDIDALSTRYLGRPYPRRDRARVSALVAVDRWYAWDAHAEVDLEPLRLG